MHHTILVAACRRGREKTFKSEKNTSLSLEKKKISERAIKSKKMFHIYIQKIMNTFIMILFLFDYIINFINSEVSHINDAKETGFVVDYFCFCFCPSTRGGYRGGALRLHLTPQPLM